MWSPPGKHGDNQRSGITRDADSARRQRRLASEKGHRQPVLKEVVIDDEPGDLSPAQGADDTTHAARGRFDHGHDVGMPEMCDSIEHEPRCGSSGDDGHGHPECGYGMPEQVECAHMGGRDNDPLPSLMGIPQAVNILGGDRHEGCQLCSSQMPQTEQLTEIPRRHAENRSRHVFQLRSRRFWSQNLTEIGDDIFPIAWSKANPEITGTIGNAIAYAVR